MDWCDANEVGFILGLSGNTVLAALVEAVADAVRTRRAIGDDVRSLHCVKPRHPRPKESIVLRILLMEAASIERRNVVVYLEAVSIVCAPARRKADAR
jgi:hypothetical protein